MKWTPCSVELPPPNTVVVVKTGDGREVMLKMIKRTPTSRPMWFLPDKSYVYYTPTHWAYGEDFESL